MKFSGRTSSADTIWVRLNCAPGAAAAAGFVKPSADAAAAAAAAAVPAVNAGLKAVGPHMPLLLPTLLQGAPALRLMLLL
jgi:hypothetical protein